MDLRQTFIQIWHWLYRQYFRIPELPRNISVSSLLLGAAFAISSLLIGHTGGENNSALVFVMAVVCIFKIMGLLSP